jgi:hypothetical protein
MDACFPEAVETTHEQQDDDDRPGCLLENCFLHDFVVLIIHY